MMYLLITCAAHPSILYLIHLSSLRCVELIINEQMRKYRARLKDISSLEFAESKAKSRLTHIRKSMVRPDAWCCRSPWQQASMIACIILIACNWGGSFPTCSSHSSLKQWQCPALRAAAMDFTVTAMAGVHSSVSIYIFHQQIFLCICYTSKKANKITQSKGTYIWNVINRSQLRCILLLECKIQMLNSSQFA